MDMLGETLFRRLCNNFRAQMNATKMWMDILKKNRDTSAIRNAAFALGKLSGMGTEVMATAEVLHMKIPDDIVAAIEEGPAHWDFISG